MSQGEKIKLVMIDDEEALLVVVKANLEDTGEFEVVTSNDPKSAEALVQAEKPDVVLLDNVMPERSGADIIQSIKKLGSEIGKTPIVMVSGKGEMVYNKKKDEFKWMPNNPVAREMAGHLPEAKSAEALAQAYGIDDYVSKPFTTEVLVDVIKEVLSRKRKPKSDEGSSSSEE